MTGDCGISVAGHWAIGCKVFEKQRVSWVGFFKHVAWWPGLLSSDEIQSHVYFHSALITFGSQVAGACVAGAGAVEAAGASVEGFSSTPFVNVRFLFVAGSNQITVFPSLLCPA